MPIVLKCDAPDCEKTAEAKLTEHSRLLLPTGWWAMTSLDGPKVACCDEHLVGQTMRRYVPA